MLGHPFTFKEFIMSQAQVAVNLSPAAQKILGHIAKGVTTREALAKKMRTTVAAVNGSITALKRNEIVQLDDEGTIELLKQPSDITVGAGTERTPRSHSKMAKARTIFNRMHAAGKERHQILPKLVALGLTDKGASTYYQTLKTQFDAAPPAAKTSRRQAVEA